MEPRAGLKQSMGAALQGQCCEAVGVHGGGMGGGRKVAWWGNGGWHDGNAWGYAVQVALTPLSPSTPHSGYHGYASMKELLHKLIPTTANILQVCACVLGRGGGHRCQDPAGVCVCVCVRVPGGRA